MKNEKGIVSAVLGIFIGFIAISILVYWVIGRQTYVSDNSWLNTNMLKSVSSQTSGRTFGLKQYTDRNFGFSFWYPGNWEVREKPWTDKDKFPGSNVVKYLEVGPAGGIYVFEVSSPKGMITDNPGAEFLPPVNYSWDTADKTWMISWPEGNTSGQFVSTTTASTTVKTMSGLPMLAGTSRFHTSIIPLSKDKFVVVGDGGEAIADYLARTVTPIGGSIDSPEQSAVLKAEADAYAVQN